MSCYRGDRDRIERLLPAYYAVNKIVVNCNPRGYTFNNIQSPAVGLCVVFEDKVMQGIGSYLELVNLIVDFMLVLERSVYLSVNGEGQTKRTIVVS